MIDLILADYVESHVVDEVKPASEFTPELRVPYRLDHPPPAALTQMLSLRWSRSAKAFAPLDCVLGFKSKSDKGPKPPCPVCGVGVVGFYVAPLKKQARPPKFHLACAAFVACSPIEVAVA